MLLASRPRKVLYAFLSLILTFSLSGLPALALPPEAGLASVEGQIVAADGRTPLAGVVLRVSPAGSEQIYRSEATDAEGRFSLSELPPGTYGLALETPNGVIDSAQRVTLAPGKVEGVILGLAPARTEDKDDNEGDIEDDDDDDALGWWNNPLTMTFVVIGGLTVIAWGIDEGRDDPADDEDEEVPVSPHAP